MATLVLGALGRAVGGPVGGIVGTFLGGAVDRAVFGGGRTREGARLSNLAVQSSAYGEPLPRLYGRMRVAGNLIWTSGIAEHASTSGGGKRGGARTTSYSYSASFAVALSARRIVSVARIWADGKLLRDGDGAWLAPATLRVHPGSDGQPADPLIVAAEGARATPAYRGIAYALFEDLALGDYGNRIPNLTFEVLADTGDDEDGGRIDAGLAIADLCGKDAAIAGTFGRITGFAAARAGSVRAQLEPLVAPFDLSVGDDGGAPTLRAGSAAPVALAAGDLGSSADGTDPHARRQVVRAAADTLDDAVALGFADPARDFQPGLQRAARRAGLGRTAQVEVALALDAVAAKALAQAMLTRRAAARSSATLHLPVRGLGVRAGASVTRPGLPGTWRVRRWTFAGFASELTVERVATVPGVAAADAGRAHDFGDAAPGATTLAVLDLPPLAGALADGPRLHVAAAGASPGWRRCGVALSLDGGESYVEVGIIDAPSIMGVAATPLAAGDATRWDRLNAVEVVVLNRAMWLEGHSEAAVLAGANVAAIGDEIVQFADVVALGDGRFRLSTLLRGRRGSSVAAHPAGSRFVLLDATRLLALEPGSEALGRTVRVRAMGSGDSAAAGAASLAPVGGAALRPLAPVFLRHARDGGDGVFTWVRRSRSGFAWLDGVDAPLGEAREAYLVALSVAGVTLRENEVSVSSWRYTAAERAADGIAPGATVELAVAQLSEAVGASGTARRSFVLT